VVYCAVSSPEQIAWTGFKRDIEILRTKKFSKNGKDITITTKYVSGKTLWDWLSVLGVPLSLAVLGFWFQQQQQIRSNQQAERENSRAIAQAKNEMNIAESNQKEEVLQAYYDQLATLLIDKNLIAIAVKVAESGDAAKEDQELLSASSDVI
jgi:glutaminase